MKFDEKGRELPDPTPMAPPVGFKKQPTMVEMIRNMVRSEALRQAAAAQGQESFEEADDFDVGEDVDPSAPYEEQFEPTPIGELRRRAQEAAAEPPRAPSGGAAAASPPVVPTAPVEPPKA